VSSYKASASRRAAPAGKVAVAGKPGKVSRDVAATALAICVLQRSYPILLGTLNPTAERLPFVVVGFDGEWMDHRRLKYPPQVRDAVRQLKEDHLRDASSSLTASRAEW
jgi:hypothetical protein